MDFTDAVIRQAFFDLGWDSKGFLPEHLYSTASYQEHDLTGLGLRGDLSGWDFQDQNLTNARFESANFENTNLVGANLKNSHLTEVDDLASAKFDASTIFNQWTVFPAGFDPIAAGLTLDESAKGDLDADNLFDVDDIDLLAQKIIDPEDFVGFGSLLPDEAFDLNGDRLLNQGDHRIWVKELKGTYFGDANLDGQFNSPDLTTVLKAAKYGLDVDTNWAEGDWTGDGRFDAHDITLALQDGGYNRGALAAVGAVPEPSAMVLLAVGAMLWAANGCRQRRSCKS